MSGAQTVSTRTDSPFDQLAADYDEDFSHGLVGGLLRRAVWRRMDRLFEPGQRLLELGCGTGEDTLHLARRGVQVVAVDASQAMVDAARAKIAHAELGDVATVQRLGLDELARHPLDSSLDGPRDGLFDGAVSSFGALNCVDDLAALADGLAPRIRSGGRLLLGIMGPWVPWEWAWFLARGKPSKALRRLRPGGARWRGLRIRYPSVGVARRAFRRHFRPLGARALGLLLPPTYAEPWARSHPRLLHALAHWERRLERVPPLVRLADHYQLELERRHD